MIFQDKIRNFAEKRKKMKTSKLTKSNDPVKILRMISRNEQMERNGGGQFVAVNRIWKDKSKYDRKAFKKGLRNVSQPYIKF